jgi:hypothetical protein
MVVGDPLVVGMKADMLVVNVRGYLVQVRKKLLLENRFTGELNLLVYRH